MMVVFIGFCRPETSTRWLKPHAALTCHSLVMILRRNHFLSFRTEPGTKLKSFEWGQCPTSDGVFTHTARMVLFLTSDQAEACRALRTRQLMA